MPVEDKARAGVQEMIPDDEITDVALTFPLGYTRMQGAGMLLGGAAMGGGGGFSGVGMVLGSAVGGKLFANLKDMPASIVLAISPTAVYALGRSSSAPWGGHWDDLVPMVRFDRDKLHVDAHQTAMTLEITLTDTEHDVSLELEAKRLGNLDAKAIVELLRLSDAHVEDEVEGEDTESR